MGDLERHATMENRITELEEALRHLLEVQVKPSTDHHNEWTAAVHEARAALRRKA